MTDNNEREADGRVNSFLDITELLPTKHFDHLHYMKYGK
ncbi:hypothetical protein PESP_a0840 [Pseudoalteromonas espejiana DSM 9414]|nr:hypothetical protein PESP_a0840 [Pseudoalteromonas espejiana DSM 9414]